MSAHLFAILRFLSIVDPMECRMCLLDWDYLQQFTPNSPPPFSQFPPGQLCILKTICPVPLRVDGTTVGVGSLFAPAFHPDP